MKNLLYHFFVPYEHNNHRAKLLHHGSIFIFSIVFIFLSFFVQTVKTERPDILGLSYSIAENEILNLTNRERSARGLREVALNEQLSEAARSKAKDMFSKNYWAHFAPDGTTPWYFIKNSGYSYLYAGENLAKGFSTSNDVVTAWMNSASHRENMLSDKYSDVGFAIAEGKLLGEDTVLVVEMFGNTNVPVLAKNPTVQNQAQERIARESSPANVMPTPIALLPSPAPKQQSVQSEFVPSARSKTFLISPIFNAFNFPKNTTIVILFLFLAALVVDFVVIERKKLPRIVGHNLDHIFLVLLFIIFIILQRQGFIF